MTHIHSNWKNTYTNGITSTDCYMGCTAITHCDGIDLGITDYYKGLDEIPLTWGGHEFTKAYTGIYRVEIPTDNYVWSVYGGAVDDGNTFGLIGNKIVDWGDGTVTTGYGTHTYVKAGKYIIKGNTGLTRPGNGTWASVRDVLTEIIQFPTSVTAHTECYLSKKLKRANFTGCRMTGAMFTDCSSLTEVILTNTTIYGDVSRFFKNASSLLNVDFSTTTFENLTNINNFFYGCAKLKSLDVSRMSTSNVRQMHEFCTGCSSLTSLDLSHFDISNVNSLSDMFMNCSSLSYLNITGWDFKNVTNVYNMLSNVGLQTIDTSTWLNTGNITNFANFCNGATSEYITLTFSGSMWAVMHACKNVKHVTWKNCTVVIDNYSFPSFGVQQTAKWQITFDNAIIESQNGTVGNLQQYSHLTVESLMSIINALMDRTGMDSSTLTIGSTNLAKLTPEQIKVATDKNWTVV